MRLSAGAVALRSAMPPCILVAHRRASTTLLNEQSVAGGLDEPSLVRGDGRIEQLGSDRFQCLKSAALIRSDQSRIARHIGGEDRGKTAGRGHSWDRPLFESSVPLTVAHLAHQDMRPASLALV